jgi:hypothetical protein
MRHASSAGIMMSMASTLLTSRQAPGILQTLATIVLALIMSADNLRAQDQVPSSDSLREQQARNAAFYLSDIKPLLKSKCWSCHGPIRQEAGLRLDTVPLLKKGGDSGPAVQRDNVSESLLLHRITATDESIRMPPEAEPVSPEQIARIVQWLQAGTIGPENEEPQSDPVAHWSFQPLQRPVLPATGHPIDLQIDQQLQQAGLQRSELAAPVDLIRRLYLDLHGLPPEPADLDRWGPLLADADSRDSSVRNLVDELLDSPRYGERWAQHWLDVVRYADTHGYEVNTPRPNAWPYRDYVIQAFNTDLPFNRFIFEQLAGDTVNADAATGFLVAAAALLPGQIGQDEASKRLARQDELDEIIIGTTASFLGLTVGCARCHDHKFDPISQADYYSMQAFFAGVDYGDRNVVDDDYRQRVAQADALQPRIAEIRHQLVQQQPVVSAGRTLIIDDEDLEHVTLLKTKNGHGSNPEGKGRGYRDDVGSADRMNNLSSGRYTWWDNHPGENVFTWNPAVSGRFRLWISWGVHGSGVHTRDARYVLDADGDLTTTADQQEVATADQYYFAGQTAGISEQTPLWSGLQDAGIHNLTEASRLILRGGETGTGITADVIVLQEDAAAGLPKLRAPVSALKTVERFSEVTARFVRFTSFATTNNNRYEPCLDELEVFTAGDNPQNIALASQGTRASSSGNLSDSGRHQLPHIHDGRYGNNFSWISNELGKGWVQLEFSEARSIDRVEWARDREGQFTDRLPVQYVVQTSLDGQTWTTVAGSDDRVALGTPHDDLVLLQRHGQATDQHQHIAALAQELSQLEQQETRLRQQRTVFAGRFREPEPTFLLNRGDPEQPTVRMAPHIPAAFSEISQSATSLDQQTPDQQRRSALARWIASEQNPLTARVIVNRIWQHHFGVGLVETPSDFGLNGAAPSHPGLLDWLAAELMEHGWSIKHVHRLILTSGTFQQSSLGTAHDFSAGPDPMQVDGDNRLLWHYPSRRLEAEAIRDALLQVSGQLNLKMGGPGFDLFKTRGGLSGFPPVEEFTPQQLRRMIYAHRIRMEPVPIFGAFDCPDAGLPTPRRSQSTTAIQALNLLNNQFVIDQAKVFADRAQQSAGDDLQNQVHMAFRLALGRHPTQTELAAVMPVVTEHGLATLCRALFNSSEFLFIP